MLLIRLIIALDFINGDFFGKLYDKHKKKVYAIVYRYTNNKQDTEEIVQDIFINIWKAINRFKNIDEKEEKALIVKYTRNKIIDFYRQKKSRITTISLEYENEFQIEIPDFAQNPETIFFDKEDMQKLVSYVQSLPTPQREVIELKYGLGISNQEISEILIVNTDIVNSRIYRAKKALEKMIEDDKEKSNAQ